MSSQARLSRRQPNWMYHEPFMPSGLHRTYGAYHRTLSLLPAAAKRAIAGARSLPSDSRVAATALIALWSSATSSCRSTSICSSANHGWGAVIVSIVWKRIGRCDGT
jgi:hypothetical protein